MSEPIYPLREISRVAMVEPAGASCRHVADAIRDVVEKLSFTIEGGELKQMGGNVHIKVTLGNGAASVSPFKVTLDNNSITVAPGLVYSSQSIQGPWCIPVINGVPLNASNVPALPFSSSGQGFVFVQAQFNTDGSAANWPWPIIASQSLPQDTPLIRDNSVGSPQPGTYNILIASVSGGIVNQWVQHNLCVNLQWEQLYIEG